MKATFKDILDPNLRCFFKTGSGSKQDIRICNYGNEYCIMSMQYAYNIPRINQLTLKVNKVHPEKKNINQIKSLKNDRKLQKELSMFVLFRCIYIQPIGNNKNVYIYNT